MQLKQVRDNINKFGLAAGLHDVGKRAVNKVLPLRVLRAVLLLDRKVPVGTTACDESMASGFADQARLLQALADPRLDMSTQFVAESLARGDRCYAIWDGKALVSYGWYSRQPTLIAPRVHLHFSSDYVYMYKGYTLPEYRGHRLHAVGMARALSAYSHDEQVRGMLSYVESHNFSSLRSCYRMGYEDVGTIYLVTLPGGSRELGWTTGRCGEFGMRVAIS